MQAVPCRGYRCLSPEDIPLASDPEETAELEDILGAQPGCSRSTRSGRAILICVSVYAVVYGTLHLTSFEVGQDRKSNGTTSDGEGSPFSLSNELRLHAGTTPFSKRHTLVPAPSASREWPVPPPEWRLPKLQRPAFNADSVPGPRKDQGAPTTAASLNARFHVNPWDVYWPEDGSLADAGLLIHTTRSKHGHVRVPSYKSTHGNMCTSMVYGALKLGGGRPGDGGMPLYNGGHSGVVFRPGVAQIVCGKPHDTGGSCSLHHCKPDGIMSFCTWLPNETGYYLKKTLEQRRYVDRYNEIMVNASYWPSDIIEASFGDPVLPPPHFRFDPTNWESPFT